MKLRWDYALLLVLALAFWGGLIYTGRPLSSEALAPLAGYRLFPNLTRPEQIIGMELIIPEREFAIAIVVEDNQATWRLREAPFTEIRPDEAMLARDLLGLMEGISELKPRDIPSETLGLLPNPEYVIRFQLDTLQVITLYVGNLTPSGEAYYVSSGDSNAIVLVLTTWIDNFVLSMLSIQPYDDGAGGSTQPPSN